VEPCILLYSKQYLEGICCNHLKGRRTRHVELWSLSVLFHHTALSVPFLFAFSFYLFLLTLLNLLHFPPVVPGQQRIFSKPFCSLSSSHSSSHLAGCTERYSGMPTLSNIFFRPFQYRLNCFRVSYSCSPSNKITRLPP
jgi:hypothetical protein